jgi:hypothetical protein
MSQRVNSVSLSNFAASLRSTLQDLLPGIDVSNITPNNDNAIALCSLFYNLSSGNYEEWTVGMNSFIPRTTNDNHDDQNHTNNHDTPEPNHDSNVL